MLSSLGLSVWCELFSSIRTETARRSLILLRVEDVAHALLRRGDAVRAPRRALHETRHLLRTRLESSITGTRSLRRFAVWQGFHRDIEFAEVRRCKVCALCDLIGWQPNADCQL